MQIRESNFFPTQINTSQRYILHKSKNSLSVELEQKQNIHPSVRIREVKSEVKKVTNIYNQAMRDYLRTKMAIDKANGDTQKLREQFVKLYGNKKLKLTNKSLMENKKHIDEKNQQEAFNRVRTLKLNNDLGLIYTRNQCQVLTERTRDQSRKFSEDLQKQLRLRRKEEFDEAKEKHEQIRKGKTEFLIRKKNMTAISSTRAYHNYLLKVNQEIQILDSYSKLIDQINEMPEISGIKKPKLENFSKTFFISTKHSLV